MMKSRRYIYVNIVGMVVMMQCDAMRCDVMQTEPVVGTRERIMYGNIQGAQNMSADGVYFPRRGLSIWELCMCVLAPAFR